MAAAVTELAQKYKGEFTEVVKDMQVKASHLEAEAKAQLATYQKKLDEMTPTIKQKRDEAVKALNNLEAPVADKSHAVKLMEIFAWTSVLQFGHFAAAIFIGSLLSFLFNAFLSTSNGFLLAYGVLPAAIYYRLSNTDTSSDAGARRARFMLLAFAIAEGALTGWMLSERYLSAMQPIGFLSSGAMAVVAVIVFDALGKNRAGYVGALIGGSVAVQLLFGIILGQLSLPYFLLTLFYAGIGFATVQFYLAYAAGDPKSAGYHYMLGYYVAAIYAQALVFLLFGMDYETYSKGREAAAAANK